MSLTQKIIVDFSAADRALRLMEKRWQDYSRLSKEQMSGVQKAAEELHTGAISESSAINRVVGSITRMAAEARAEMDTLLQQSAKGLIDSRTVSRQMERIREEVAAVADEVTRSFPQAGAEVQEALAAAAQATGANIKGQERHAREGKRAIAELGDEHKRTEDKAKRAAQGTASAHEQASSRVRLAWGRVLGWLGGLFAGFSAVALGRSMIKLNADLETTAAAFTTMIGSAKEAQDALDQMYAFAQTAPFALVDIQSAGRILLSMGSSTDSLTDELRMLGDISSGVGMSLKELADIYGKNRMAGRLYMEDIHQLANRGIPIYRELAVVMGVNESKVRDLVTTGQIGFREMEQAFQRMTAKGGVFFGMTETQSQTFTGMLSKLKEQAKGILQQSGSRVFEMMRDDLEALLTTLKQLQANGSLRQWTTQAAQVIAQAYTITKRFGSALAEWGPTLARVAGAVAVFRVGLLITSGVIRTKAALLVAWRLATYAVATAKSVLTGQMTRATAAQAAFNAVTKANPIGFLLSALAAVVTYFTLFRSRADEATRALREQEQQIQENIRAVRALSGAALASRSLALTGEVEDLNRELRQTRAEMERLSLLTSRRTVQVFDPSSGTTVERDVSAVPSAMRERREAAQSLITLRARELELINEIEGTQRAQAAAEEKLSTDLLAQIALLRERRELLISNNQLTDEDRDAQRRQIDNDLAKLEAERQRRAPETRGSGASPSGRDSQRMAQLSLEIRQRAELIGKSEQQQRVLEGIHRLERERMQLLGQMAELQGQDRAHASRVLEDLEAQLHAARNVSRVIEGLSRMDVRGALGPHSQEGIVGRLTQESQALNQELTRLQNLRSAGRISDEAYYTSVQAASDRYLASLRALYNQLVTLGLITPENEAAFQQMFSAGERAADEAARGVQGVREEAEKLDTVLGDLAAGMRALGRLGSVFGGISREMDNLIQGTADVLDNLQRMGEARKRLQEMEAKGAVSGAQKVLGQTLPAIGIAAGVLTAISGIVGFFRSDSERRREEAKRREEEAKKQAEQLERLRQALQDNVRALRENLKRDFEGGRVGQTRTQDQVRGATTRIDSFTSLWDREFEARFRELERQLTGNVFADLDIQRQIDALFREFSQAQSSAAREFFQWAAQSGFDVSAYEDVYNSLLEQFGGDARAAFEALLIGAFDGAGELPGLREFIDRLTRELGTFTDDVQGAITMVRSLTRYLGVDAQEAFRRFLDFLLGSVDGLSDELRDLLLSVQDVDLSTDEGRDRLRAIVATIAQIAPSLLGGLSMSDLEAILDQLLDLAGRDGQGTTGETRSAVFSRTITEVQAHELVHWLQAIALFTERSALALERGAGVAMAQAMSQMPAKAVLPAVRAGEARRLPTLTGASYSLSADVQAQFSADVSPEALRRMVPALTQEIEQKLYDTIARRARTPWPRL